MKYKLAKTQSKIARKTARLNAVKRLQAKGRSLKRTIEE